MIDRPTTWTYETAQTRERSTCDSGDALDCSDPRLYINRELSWLAFNERVLAHAHSDAHPLLERVKFLAIAANNLDEFFMIRVATLTRQHRAGLTARSPDGLTVEQQLGAARARAGRMLDRHRQLLERPAPAAAGGGRRPFPRAHPVHAGGGRVSGRLLPRQRQPRADAAGVRSRPSLSLHLEPEQELRRRGRGPGLDEVRAREGAGRPAPLHPDSRVDGRAPGRDVCVARGRRPAESRRALPGRRASEAPICFASFATRTSCCARKKPTICWSPWTRA